MAAKTFMTLVNNVRTLVTAITTSAGASDADKILATNAAGVLDPTFLPPGIGADAKSIIASETLTAGDFVNIHDNTGTANVRKASAVDGTKPAHGFVLDNTTATNAVTVFFEGANSALTGLTSGTQYVLSKTTPGGVTAIGSFVPAVGNIVQPLGAASGATEINAQISNTYTVIG